MIDPALITEAEGLLNQARMIPEASAAQTAEVARKRSRRRPAQGTSSAPGGYSVSTLQACGDRMNDAIAHDSNSELAAANRWAKREINTLRHAPAAGAETIGEFGDRVVRDHEGELAGVVARAEMSSVTTIRKLREERGREPKTGHRLAGKGLGGVTA